MPLAAGLYYEFHGPEDGEIVVLSPGLGGSGAYWQPNLAALSERYRALLYDHRGTARSDRGMPDPVSVEAMADDVVALLDTLDIDRAHLIGHAAGGIIGLAMALGAPDRLGKLVVVNGWSRLDPHFARCFDVRLGILRDSGPAAYVHAQPIFLYPAEWISRHNAEIEAGEAHHVAQFPSIDTAEQRIAALCAFDVDDRLGAISAPVLALAAADDMLVPAHCSARLAEGIPGGRLATMAWGGHACNVTDPNVFNQIALDFLRS